MDSGLTDSSKGIDGLYTVCDVIGIKTRRDHINGVCPGDIFQGVFRFTVNFTVFFRDEDLLEQDRGNLEVKLVYSEYCFESCRRIWPRELLSYPCLQLHRPGRFSLEAHWQLGRIG